MRKYQQDINKEKMLGIYTQLSKRAVFLDTTKFIPPKVNC